MLDLIDLTEAQQGILAEAMAAADPTTYFMQACYEFPLTLDAGSVREALVQLQTMHPALGVRLIIDGESGWVRQTLEPAVGAVEPECHVVAQLRADGDAALSEFLTRDRVRGIDLFGGALWRATLVQFHDKTALVISYHHIILDGWSAGILQEHLLALLNHEHVDDNDQFRDLAMNGALGVPATPTAAEMADWKEQLADCLRSPLPEAGAAQENRATSLAGEFSAGSGNAIEWAASRARTTVSSVCQVLHGIAMAVLTGDWVGHASGVVTSGRDLWSVDLRDTVGCFMRTIPVGFRPRTEDTVGEAARGILLAVLDGMSRVVPPLDDLLPIAGGGSFQDVFIFENYPANFDRMKAMGVKRWSVDRNAYPLVAFYWRTDHGIRYDIQVSESVEPGVVRDYVAIVNQLASVLELGLREQRDVATSELVRTACQVFCDFSGEGEEWQAPLLDETIHARGMSTSERGIVLDGERITWSQAVRQAAGLGSVLRMPSGSTIAVCLNNPMWAVVCIIAAIVNGWTWVPVDPTLPRERQRFIIEDARASVIVIDGDSPFEGEEGPSVVQWTALQVEVAAWDGELPPAVDPSTPAYTIYTSGSTGKPKGVLVPRRNLDGYARGMRDVLALSPSSCVLLNHSLSFDNSIWEIMLAFFAGADLVTLKDRRDFYEVLQTMVSARVRVLSVTPSQLGVLLEIVEFEPELRTAFSNLDVLFVGSEEVPAAIISRAARFLSPGARVFNEYGPTETTIVSSLHEIRLGEGGGPVEETIPIGSPTIGNIFLVADSEGFPVPRGNIGELWIGGAAVSDGYAGRPELTAEKFTRPAWDASGRRWYRTGDSVDRRADGAYVFVGRIDDQVKIRGFRVELGEVERALRMVLTDSECAVVARFDAATATSQLAAFYTDDTSMEERDMRQALESLLPSYCVPTSFIRMKSLPLNASGKIDRGELRRLAVSAAAGAPQNGSLLPAPSTGDQPAEGALTADSFPSDSNSVRPLGPGIQQAVAELRGAVERVMGHAPDLTASFKSNGGDSLSAMRVRNILALRGIELSPGELLTDIPIGRVKLLPVGAGVAESMPLEAPMSATQRGIAASSVGGGGRSYIDHMVLERDKSISMTELMRALEQVADRHGILRAVFDLEHQVWRRAERLTATVSEGAGEGIESWSSVINDWSAGAGMPRVIELRLVPLQDRSRLVVIWHHAALDGLGIDLLVSDLLGELDGQRPPSLETVPYDFITAMRAQASKPVAGPVNWRWPTRQEARADTSSHRIRRTFLLPSLARSSGSGPTARVCAALLQGVRSVAGPVSGVAVVHGRDEPGSQRVAGSYASFVNLPTWNDSVPVEAMVAEYEQVLRSPGTSGTNHGVRNTGLAVVITVNGEPRDWPVGWTEVDVFDGAPGDVIFDVFQAGERWNVIVFAEERLDVGRLERFVSEQLGPQIAPPASAVLQAVRDVLNHPELSEDQLSLSLMQLGGDSLSAVLLSRRLHRLGLTVSIQQLLSGTSVSSATKEAHVTESAAPEPRGVSRAQAGMLHEFLASGAEHAYVQSVALQIDPRFAESVMSAWEQAVRSHPEITDGFSYDGSWPQRTPGGQGDLSRVMRPTMTDDPSPEALMHLLRSTVDLSAGSCVRAGLLETSSTTWFAIAYFHALLDGDEFAALASTFVSSLRARDDRSLASPQELTVRRLTSADREIVQRVVDGAELKRLEERALRENATVAATLLADLLQCLTATLKPEEGVRIETPRTRPLATAVGETHTVVTCVDGERRDRALETARACLYATMVPAVATSAPVVSISTLLYTFDRGSALQDEEARHQGILHVLAFENPGRADALDVDFDPGVSLRVTANLHRDSPLYATYRRWLGEGSELIAGDAPNARGAVDATAVERVVSESLTAMGCSVTSSSETLAQMGLDSLRVFALRKVLMDALGCEVSLSDLGPTRTIASICAAIARNSVAPSLDPTAPEKPRPAPADLSERDLAHLKRLEHLGPDLSIVPLWIPDGVALQRADQLLRQFWSRHAWLGRTIAGNRWISEDETPRIRVLDTLGLDEWEGLKAEFGADRALAKIVRVHQLGITLLVLDHILYDQDVLDELETEFLKLSGEGSWEASSAGAFVSGRGTTFEPKGTDRPTVDHDGWRLEFSCRPELLYERLCDHLQRWGQAHDSGTLRVLKHVRAEDPDPGRGGDHHVVEHWTFDVPSRQLNRSSVPWEADKTPNVHLSVVEANPRLPGIRLLPTEVARVAPPSADGLCSADIEVLLQRDSAVVQMVSCGHLAP